MVRLGSPTIRGLSYAPSSRQMTAVCPERACHAMMGLLLIHAALPDIAAGATFLLYLPTMHQFMLSCA